MIESTVEMMQFVRLDKETNVFLIKYKTPRSSRTLIVPVPDSTNPARVQEGLVLH